MLNGSKTAKKLAALECKGFELFGIVGFFLMPSAYVVFDLTKGNADYGRELEHILNATLK